MRVLPRTAAQDYLDGSLNKLRESGLAWITSETLQMYLLQMGAPPGPLAGAVAMALPSSRCLCHCRRALPSTGAGFEPFRDLLDPCRHFLTSRHQTNDGNFVPAIDFGSSVLAALGFPGRKGIVETAGRTPSRGKPEECYWGTDRSGPGLSDYLRSAQSSFLHPRASGPNPVVDDKKYGNYLARCVIGNHRQVKASSYYLQSAFARALCREHGSEL